MAAPMTALGGGSEAEAAPLHGWSLSPAGICTSAHGLWCRQDCDPLLGSRVKGQSRACEFINLHGCPHLQSDMPVFSYFPVYTVYF